MGFGDLYSSVRSQQVAAESLVMSGVDKGPQSPGGSRSGEITFEVFVKNAILRIQKEAGGSRKEVVEIRKACQAYLEKIGKAENNAKLGIPFDEEATQWAMEPLSLACGCSIPRIVEPALGCLHKLVAYAWIQGESSPAGHLDDGTIVSKVVAMVVRCVELHNAGVNLAIMRALLTLATAEHFIAHGQCLLHVVRSVFNLAVSSDDPNLKRPACNSLLQMLNTIIKRVTVTQYQLRTRSSRLSQSTIDSPRSAQGSIVQEMEEQLTSAIAENSGGGAGNGVVSNEASPSAEEPDDVEMPASSSLTAKLASLAEQEDIRGLEAALEKADRQNMEDSGDPQSDQNAAGPSQNADGSAQADSTGKESKSVKESGARETGRRPKGWDRLTPLEKDVLIVLTAFCKLAGVTPTSGPNEEYVRQGKLLALELLVKVFENQSHSWDHVRLEFCEQLRVPLCLVLIRNCNPEETKAFQFAIRLFTAIMLHQQIRFGLKAELGALYPLLILRPLEMSPLDPALLTVAMGAVKKLSSRPQMQVDVFINYDCNMQAANLYERTAKNLSHLAVYGDPAAPPGQSVLVRDAAVACTVAMLNSLDVWAGPIQDAASVGGAQQPSDMSFGILSSNGTAPLARDTEVKHFSASKAQKTSKSVGIDMFNKNPLKGIASLVASKVVQNKAEALAKFLRQNRDALDELMLGEYLGHHDEMPIKVMHAYIDMEQYMGLTIDAALRKLMGGFRLPGEAQKIDRIMEKFAERYCRDNPGIFGSADHAYVLAFAVIMLNTDAHNPMAEKKLMKADFVAMNCRLKEDGTQDEVPVLPVSELEAIFDRVTSNEIRSRSSGVEREDEVAVHRRLASAVGLTQIALPFRASIIWNKEQGVRLEHRRLLEITRKAMRSGALGGDVWFAASHAEHAHPMLEAAGPNFLQTLAAALESASEKASAERAVESLKMGIRLCALLGCDALCQQMVGILAKSSGVQSRDGLLRANPHCQVLALKALIALATEEHSGLLGNSWTIILRTISSVETLVSELRRAPQSDASNMDALQRRTSSSSVPPAASIGRTEKAPQTNAFGRFLSQIGLAKASEDLDGRLDGLNRPGVGGAVRVWANGRGTAEMDKVYVGSSKLDGEAVLVFTRALCAVSHEELHPEDESIRPKVFSLRKLVECAYYNLGRIRLVWGRLWSTIAAHLVNASCHPDQTVAMYAVDSLRQLVGKLLSRAELANFTTQGDSLRPFVMVLRHCSSVIVREMTVQCIDQAMNVHSRRLGSGWIVVLEVLSMAADDPGPSVVRQCLDTLEGVISEHWRKWGKGHDVLSECVKVAEKCARNPYHIDSSLKGIELLQKCARELVKDTESVGEENIVVVRSASLDLDQISSPVSASHRPFSRSVSVPESSQIDFKEPETVKESLPVIDDPPAQHSLWALIFKALVDIIMQDERRRCADMAADALYGFVSESSKWDLETWKAFIEHGVNGVFDVQRNLHAVPGGLDRVLSYSHKFLPVLWKTLAEQYSRVGALLLPYFLDLLVVWMRNTLQPVAVTGVQLLELLIDAIVGALDPAGWGVVVGTLKEIWRACVCTGAERRTSMEEYLEPFKAWLQGPDGPLHLPGMRSRCQVLVAFQRYLHDMHKAYGECIPEALQLDLVDILLDSVHQAALINRDADFLSSLEMHISVLPRHPSGVLPDSVVVPSDLSPSCTPLTGTPFSVGADLGDRTIDMQIEDAVIVEREPEDDPQTGGSAENVGSAGVELDDVNVRNAAASAGTDNDEGMIEERSDVEHQSDGDESGYEIVPGITKMMSQEVITAVEASEGGDAPGPVGEGANNNAEEFSFPTAEGADDNEDQEKDQEAGDEKLPEAASMQFPELVVDVDDGDRCVFQGLLRVEAEGGALAIGALLRCLSLGGNGEGSGSRCEAAESRLLSFCRELIKQAADETASTWGSRPSSDPFLLTMPLRPQWGQAVRAPVIAKALEAYKNVHGSLLTSEMRDMFPYLSSLVCSAQTPVRKALASLFNTQLPQILFREEN